jgi:hypothetical protein
MAAKESRSIKGVHSASVFHGNIGSGVSGTATERSSQGRSCLLRITVYRSTM